jgi:uncharacterized Zn finger protein
MRFDDRRFWPASKPRKAEGGIKARSQRGNFGTQWWAKRWIAVLEGFDIGTRLQRGRRYARAGQVVDISIASGIVTARVQGSRAQPYRVTIRVATLGKAMWRKIARRIASEARFAAKLIAGEMPQEIEEAFTAVGTSLFPTRLRDLHTACSCPDAANPCKHIAATYYLIGEEFDRDPFLLFMLRGATKDEILADLQDAGPARRPSASVEVPLPTDFAAFWDGTPPTLATNATATNARRRSLPAFPFWRGGEPLETVLARVDEAAVAAALELLADTESDRVLDPVRL